MRTWTHSRCFANGAGRLDIRFPIHLQNCPCSAPSPSASVQSLAVLWPGMIGVSDVGQPRPSWRPFVTRACPFPDSLKSSSCEGLVLPTTSFVLGGPTSCQTGLSRKRFRSLLTCAAFKGRVLQQPLLAGPAQGWTAEAERSAVFSWVSGAPSGGLIVCSDVFLCRFLPFLSVDNTGK